MWDAILVLWAYEREGFGREVERSTQASILPLGCPPQKCHALEIRHAMLELFDVEGLRQGHESQFSWPIVDGPLGESTCETAFSLEVRNDLGMTAIEMSGKLL